MAGEKDKVEKILEAFNDVFADIFNVLYFDGEEVILPEDLEEQTPRSYYKADGKIRDIERDVVKRWKKGNVCLACIGIENQTSVDKNMPVRIIGYDGAEYRAQLHRGNVDGELCPVTSAVLSFAYDKRWNGPTSLKERLKIHPKLDKFVNDYKINVFEIAYLTREQVSKFKSDFRFVADYFVQKRETGDYAPNPDVIEHVQATLQLLSIMANDHRFEEAYNDTIDSEKGELKTMCDVLDRIENRGRMEGKREMVVSLAGMGISIDKIAEAAKVAVDTVKQWIAEAQVQ